MNRKRVLQLVIAVPVALLLLGVVGSYAYIHFIESDPAPRLTLDTPTGSVASSGAPSTGAAPSGAIDGTWTATSDSVVGYRVHETLFGQDNEATGRTNAVAGSFTIAGTTVSDASFTVQMAQVKSDEDRRDGQFRSRIMETSRFPTATFKLTKAIDLGTLPTDSTPVTVQATGDLTLHGVTRSVTIELEAQRDGASIKVNGTLPVHFSDYQIDNPSGGPATVGGDGELEVLLVLAEH